MWQRFTERARRVVFFAQEEAARLGENYVGTEHLLLGLLREEDSVAGRILGLRLGIPLAAIRAEVEKQVTRGTGNLGQDMQLTPRAKQVIDLAYEESRQLNNNYIGTEHLLLGLIREGDGLAAKVLVGLGADLASARRETEAMQESSAEMREAEARLPRLVREQFERLLALRGDLPPPVLRLISLLDISDPLRLADAIAECVELKAEELQQLQSAATPTERLQKLHEMLEREVASIDTPPHGEQQAARAAILATLAEGQTLTGVARRIRDHGVFVEIGGVEGYLPLGEMSWTDIRYPDEVLKPGDEIQVMVLKFNPARERVLLGLRQVRVDPWSEVATRLKVGDEVTGTVARITSAGAVIPLEGGIEGLLPGDELWGAWLAESADVVQAGDPIEARITELSPAERRITLSMRKEG